MASAGRSSAPPGRGSPISTGSGRPFPPLKMRGTTGLKRPLWDCPSKDPMATSFSKFTEEEDSHQLARFPIMRSSGIPM